MFGPFWGASQKPGKTFWVHFPGILVSLEPPELGIPNSGSRFPALGLRPSESAGRDTSPVLSSPRFVGTGAVFRGKPLFRKSGLPEFDQVGLPTLWITFSGPPSTSLPRPCRKVFGFYLAASILQTRKQSVGRTGTKVVTRLQSVPVWDLPAAKRLLDRPGPTCVLPLAGPKHMICQCDLVFAHLQEAGILGKGHEPHTTDPGKRYVDGFGSDTTISGNG